MAAATLSFRRVPDAAGAGVILIAALVLLGWAVLTNLIGNAWKFTGGRPEATIEIGCASTSQETTYFVGDNGAGFDMAYASKLFGVFQRLHRAEEFDGTGVGSPSCSASCSGTAGACRRRGRWIAAPPSTSRFPRKEEGRMNLTGVEILLVEDSPEDAELALRALRKQNLANRVHLVRDGAEALEFIFATGTYAGRGVENAPKVVFLDLKLPKVDGLEVLRRIKTDPRTKRIPVVVMTSSREERDIVESYELGVNSYVVKPVDFEQFVRSVSELGLYWLLLNQPPGTA